LQWVGGCDDAASGALADLTALLAASRRISGILDAAVLAQRAAAEARRLARTELSALALAEAPDLLIIRGTSGVRTPAIARLHIPSGTGLGGRILIERRPISVLDYAHDRAITRDLVNVVADDEGIRALVGVPVEHNDQLLGILYAGLRSAGSVGGRGEMILMEFARSLGPALSSARQVEQARQLSVDAERQRIAHELHDSVGQLLFGIGVDAQRAQQALGETENSGLLSDLRRIEHGVSRASSQLRDALRGLAPTDSEAALATIVRMDAAAFTDRSGVPAHLVVLGEPVSLTAAVQAVLLSVVREGLHNVEKYAHAASVVLTLYYAGDGVGVVIQDDGVGLPPDFIIKSLPTGGRHLGLASLFQRTQRLGGSLKLIANEDGGVTLRANIPVAGSVP
jgi:signal transduction histidine kinase